MSSILKETLVYIVPLLATLLLCYLCPYSKVEESFNIQAIHDIALLRSNISAYDHQSFPGVVRRTFIGSLIVYALSFPPLTLLIHLNFPKPLMQLLVRFVLGCINVASFLCFADASKQKFGQSVAWRLIWITASQFHFFYYASRTLPNSFALTFVLLSLASLLRGRDKQFVCFAGFAILVFRSELILFYGPCLLYGLLQGSVRIRWSLILTVLGTAVGSVVTSVLVDSWFWQRWVWPEGEVFYYNAVLNKSGQWGTSPFHWYFTSALPRALLSTGLLIPLWFVHTVFLCNRKQSKSNQLFGFRSTGLVFSALSFILLYSWLPHKELRFIIYAIPILNLAAALLWIYVETTSKHHTHGDKKKTSTESFWRISLHWFQRMLVWFCYLHLLVNLIGTAVLVMVSTRNYPGGEALYRFNHLEHLGKSRDVHVHICNLAAQTGVTRFLEQHSHWIYNKTEHIENDLQLLEQSQFTHLISELQPEQMRLSSKQFYPLFTVYGFSGIGVQPSWKIWNSINIRTTPVLTVYERKSFNEV